MEGNRETALWLCCNLPVSTLHFEKFQVWSQRFEYPNLNLQASSSNLPHRSLLKIPRNLTDRINRKLPPKKTWVSFLLHGFQSLVRGFLWDSVPFNFWWDLWNLSITGPPEISNDFSPRGNIQAATFKPLAPPQFLTVLISWLLNREKESPKEHEQPPKRGQICEKLGSLRHV